MREEDKRQAAILQAVDNNKALQIPEIEFRLRAVLREVGGGAGEVEEGVQRKGTALSHLMLYDLINTIMK